MYFILIYTISSCTLGVFLFVFGPLMAAFITDNLMEQASIWCFFSIAQISIMLFLIRETLIINWGRGNISVIKGGSDVKKEGVNGKDGELVLVECRDFLNCEYCAAENKRRQKEFKKMK
ncbi:hypothetical protein EON63_03035 [archaeon]|nr:MAG: hypothetical protein EON63_03035 [archaeon]